MAKGKSVKRTKAAKSKKAAPGRKPAAATRPATRAATRAATPTPPPRPRAAAGVAPGMQPVNAYLAVRDVAAALAYYERAFGFKRRLVMPGPDGSFMHAEVTHRDSVIMLGPESEQEKAAATATPRTSLYVYVSDVDRVTARARDAGGRVLHEPKDQFWGDRTATVVDGDGHHWTLATFKKLIPPDQMKPPM